MTEWILKNLNVYVVILIISIFTISIALLIHVYGRKLFKNFITGDDKKIATMFFSVNASILSLLFSITLFQVRGEFNHITNSSGQEVSQLDEARRSVFMLSDANQEEVLAHFKNYMVHVVKYEFEINIDRNIVAESNRLFDELRNTVLKIAPNTYHEKQFRNKIIRTLDNMVITRGVRLYRKDGGNGGGIFYILLLIFLLSLVFLTSHERTKTTMFYVSCYSILASVLLSVVFVSSSYFVGDHTKNRGLYVDTLREIENTISQFDVSNIKEDAEAILNPESIEEEQKE